MPTAIKAIWKFRQCPRCNGDLHLEKDFYEDYFKCFQCGHRVKKEKK